MNPAWSGETGLREQIIERIGGGESLADVERELIQPAALSEDEKAGLWLLGWSWANLHDCRRGRAPRAGFGGPSRRSRR